MQQSKYFEKNIPHPMYFYNADDNCKKYYLHVRLKQFNYVKMERCYTQIFQGITCSFRINFTTHFFPYTSFLSDYQGNKKDNFTKQ